jgi:hypothetical protein
MHRFDEDTTFASKESFSFEGRVTENWSINGVPNGGYLMAILARAMMQCSESRSTPIITANFLYRCEPGEARVLVEKTATSRQFNRFQASLVQSGKENIRAFGTFASEKNVCVLERNEGSAPGMAELEKCVAVPELPDYSLFSRMDIRLDPDCVGWMFNDLNEISEMKGWIKFKRERPFDVLSSLLIADSFPPAVLSSQGMVAWVPTLEFSVNMRQVPTTEWLQCVFRTRFITCGLLEEDGEIWDEEGDLIAISRQIAQYRSQTG